jgi:hypothetical protein
MPAKAGHRVYTDINNTTAGGDYWIIRFRG